MQVVVKKRALNSINATARYIESINTKGSGDRWANKLYDEIEKIALYNVSFALCKNESLAKFKYSCMVFKDWVIAFRLSANKLEICRFIYGPYLD